MIRVSRVIPAVIAAVALSGTLLGATTAQSPAPPVDTTAVTSLKLTVVISRYQGEKKTGSLPFELMVLTGPGTNKAGDMVNLQMGAEVPVPVLMANESKSAVTGSYQYRSLGTSIVATALRVDTEHFSVNLQVTDSQLMADAASSIPGGPALPRFQNFRSNNRLILRDGQTIQYIAATDKMSGEVAKIDVTLNVVR